MVRPRLKKLLLALPFALSTSACKSPDSRQHLADTTLDKPAHHTETGFRNLHIKPIDKGVFGYLKMRYFGDHEFADHRAEAHRVPIAEPNFDQINRPGTAPQITWLGHATLLIQYQGINILTDPILSNRASAVSFAGPERLIEMPIPAQDLPRIDYVIISHNHYDHLDLGTIKQLGNTPVYLVPLNLKEWFVNEGIDPTRVQEFDWWDSSQFKALTVTATPSQHWSARGPFDRFETLWAAWHLQLGNFSLWFAGDTGYNEFQFKEIGARLNNIDVALIPIGAYAPRFFMREQHVDPAEALKIHQDLGTKLSIGMHWGTFELSAEPIMEPVERIDEAVTQGLIRAEEFITLAVGETHLYIPNL